MKQVSSVHLMFNDLSSGPQGPTGPWWSIQSLLDVVIYNKIKQLCLNCILFLCSVSNVAHVIYLYCTVQYCSQLCLLLLIIQHRLVAQTRISYSVCHRNDDQQSPWDPAYAYLLCLFFINCFIYLVNSNTRQAPYNYMTQCILLIYGIHRLNVCLIISYDDTIGNISQNSNVLLSGSRQATVCRRLPASAVPKTADIMSLSVSFMYGKWVVPCILSLFLLFYQTTT